MHLHKIIHSSSNWVLFVIEKNCAYASKWLKRKSFMFFLNEISYLTHETIKDLLMSAEYIMQQGNSQVILCERGIRTFETATRNTFDLAAIPVLKRETHLPVFADPSHAGGRRDLVAPLAFAAIAAGADGLLVEVHPNPESAWSDGDQSLDFAEFERMMGQLAPFAEAAGRTLAPL